MNLEQTPRILETTGCVGVFQGSVLATMGQPSAPRLTSDWHPEYCCGMVITVDSAGRLVVPKPLREQLT